MPEDELIEIGRLQRPWGLKGELGFVPAGDQPFSFWRTLERVWLEQSPQPTAVAAWRQDGGGRIFLRFAGVETPEAAKRYSGRTLFLPAGMLPPPAPGEYYTFQLIGLVARREDGSLLGEVIEVEEGYRGANDNLVLRTTDDGELTVPFIAEYVLRVEPAAGELVLRLPESEEA